MLAKMQFVNLVQKIFVYDFEKIHKTNIWSPPCRTITDGVCVASQGLQDMSLNSNNKSK